MNPDEKVTEPVIPIADNARFGRAGYEAYARFTGGKTFDGRAMPTWEQLEQRIKDAWSAAAMGIFAEANRHAEALAAS